MWSYNVVVFVAFLMGFVGSPLGFVGVTQGNTNFLVTYMFSLFGLLIVRTLVFIWDLLFVASCGGYSYNVISDTFGYPGDFPLTKKTKETLFDLEYYRTRDVNQILGFNLAVVYFPCAAVFAAFIGYCGWIVRKLLVSEKLGPAFLGPAYALDFETIDDALSSSIFSALHEEAPYFKKQRRLASIDEF